MEPTHLNSLEYLASGNERQQLAYKELKDTRIFEVLAEFSPVLAGTVPLDIDIDGSDLDIICEAKDLHRFESLVRMSFGHFPSFKLVSHQIRGVDSVIANFRPSKFGIELFCQRAKVTHQYAVIHLLVEHRLLKLGGEKMRAEIRSLKEQGMKTEPAFAFHLGLSGDPYDALATLTAKSDKELAALIERKK